MNRHWRRLPFTEVLSDETAGNIKTLQSDFKHGGAYPIVDQGINLVAGYTDDSARLCRAPLPAIVFGDHTRCFKYVDFPFCIGADGTKVLRNRIEADQKYLYHFLRQAPLPNAGYSRHFKFLKELDIPLPPLDEQRRIAAILEKAESLRTMRASSLTMLDSLMKSTFIDTFGDPATNPMRWEVLPLAELGEVVTGNTPPRANPAFYGGELEWIKSDNLNTDQEFATTAEEYLSEQGRRVARVAPKNAVLVTCIAGSPSCIGNAAILDREAAFNQQINAIIPRIVDPLFLYAQIIVAKQLIQNASTAGMKGMVNKSRFEKIQFLAPPRQLQDSFAKAFALILRAKRSMRLSLSTYDTLLRSLQDRAFREEL